MADLSKSDPDLTDYELFENGTYESYCVDTLRKYGDQVYFRLSTRKSFLVWHRLQKAPEESGLSFEFGVFTRGRNKTSHCHQVSSSPSEP